MMQFNIWQGFVIAEIYELNKIKWLHYYIGYIYAILNYLSNMYND